MSPFILIKKRWRYERNSHIRQEKKLKQKITNERMLVRKGTSKIKSILPMRVWLYGSKRNGRRVICLVAQLQL